MPILRLGPWGKMGLGFFAQGDELTVPKPAGVENGAETSYLPVNCANKNIAFGTKWTSYYTVRASDCCTPASLNVIWPVTYDFGATFTYVSKTILRGTYDPLTAEVVDQTGALCYYGYAQYPGGYNFPDYQGEVFTLYWNGSSWQCYFGNEYFAQQDNQTLDSTDACDPTGVTTISGTAYYDGYTITVTDPNA